MSYKKSAVKSRRSARYQEEDAEIIGFSKNRRSSRERKTPAAPTNAINRLHKINVEPKTENQARMLELLESKTITIAVGLAGTGKSFLAVYAAVRALALGEIDSIVVTRAMTTVGKAIGHLPGTEQEKLLPYVAPMIEYLSEFLGREEVNKMMKADTIRVIPLALLRGYTFRNSFIILDEAQNTTPMEFKTILTRIGEGSKMAVLGDLEQSDIERPGFVNGLEDFVDRMTAHRDKYPDEDVDIGGVEFGLDDIQRSAIVRQVIEIYDVDPSQ